MMNPGEYYIGDLCYVLEDEWSEVCDLIIRDGQCLDGEFELSDGRRFAIYGTKHGDGCYQSNINTTHGVDSGSIGCIRADQCDPSGHSYGAVVTFDAKPFPTDENNGVISFGHVRIDTAN